MKDKPIMKIENILHEYICNYCMSNNIKIDCRFRYFGDENKYYICNNGEFLISCITYAFNTVDIEEVKTFITQLIDTLWNEIKSPNSIICLYIEDVIITKQGYSLFMGGFLFEDDTVLVNIKRYYI